MIPYVYNPNNMNNMTTKTIIKYNKINNNDICGTIQTGTMSKTYNSNTNYQIVSTKTNYTTYTNNATSEYTVTPCTNGTNIKIDNPNMLTNNINNFIIYINDNNSYYNEITNNTFNKTSSGDVNNKKYTNYTKYKKMLP